MQIPRVVESRRGKSSLDIIIACGAMPFGWNTPWVKSLGGSETAALMLGKSLAKRHRVTMFCNLPQSGPDAMPSGTVAPDGVRYVDIRNLEALATTTPHDVFIALRDPNIITLPALARKKILWMHDIATKRGIARAFDMMGFTFDEIWTVSEWHRQQVAQVTNFPLERIVALRNGIVKYDDIPLPGTTPSKKRILYASRPERALDNLIKPGGVMEHLPDYTLTVCMYEHFPEHMRSYYEQIFARMKAMPNVEFIGGKPNEQLRQIIAESAAYIYPTQFEETSCILARECIEQGTPFFTTKEGALPETLGTEGLFFEDWLAYTYPNLGTNNPEKGSPDWCQLFALFFRDTMGDEYLMNDVRKRMLARRDLYWDGVADMVEPRLDPPGHTAFSTVWSLIQDGDVIPALAYFGNVQPGATPAIKALARELELYSFINGDLAEYYDRIYREKGEGAESELHFLTENNGGKHLAIEEQIAKLPAGSRVLDYGCGPGHCLGPLAVKFPEITFVGFDFSRAAVNVVNMGAHEHGLKNLSAVAQLYGDGEKFDAVICSEVLEHVVEPWKELEKVESFCKPGGRMICTTPFGKWEPINFMREGHFHERYHLWQIDREMMEDMLGNRPNRSVQLALVSRTDDLRPIGQMLYAFDATHEPVKQINPLQKALRHNVRDTVAAAMIAYNNEATILNTLNSLNGKVDFVQIAHGPSTDHTREYIDAWFAARPWMRYNVIDVPKIEPYKFGFDDARNASVEGLERDFDWLLWIDTDEYLSGDFRKYLRPSCFDGYMVCQHHFTCEPRGTPCEIDRPARLIRLDRDYRCFGHIHEHFEIGHGKGPGRCYLLPDVDLGHPGYVNELTRRSRFFRNFPFLEWEHNEPGPKRPLHYFIWFRDIIHRMRFTQDPAEKVKLAQEAIDWYNTHKEEMAAFGPGLQQSLAYISEINQMLGRGVPLRFSLQLDDRQAQIEGRFNGLEEVQSIINTMLKGEFEARTSRYF